MLRIKIYDFISQGEFLVSASSKTFCLTCEIRFEPILEKQLTVVCFKILLSF
jgi:hypothetical protein